ncbi:MAG: hypothetical protein M5F18_03560 [Asgard group archaeon]|nr:hypothetical protein [Asgard group archaeon]
MNTQTFLTYNLGSIILGEQTNKLTSWGNCFCSKEGTTNLKSLLSHIDGETEGSDQIEYRYQN